LDNFRHPKGIAESALKDLYRALFGVLWDRGRLSDLEIH
jgi:hypothetical protein